LAGLFCGGALASSSLLLVACPGPGFTVVAHESDAGDAGDPACTAMVIDNKCGVFVAPAGSDDKGSGTREAPYQTLTKAISAAEQSGTARVYACLGAYEEAITVPGGMQIYGGLSCEDMTWMPSMMKSALNGKPDEIPIRFKGGATSTLDHFTVTAASAMTPGGSSIAVIVEPMAAVDLQECDVVAGSGAPGAAGSPPRDAPMTTGVTPDNMGVATCTNMSSNAGGAEHVNDCSGETSIGGAGGDGSEDVGEKGQEGTPATMNDPSGDGGTAATVCGSGGDGKNGAPGAQGASGNAAQGLGSLSVATGWMGVAGGQGGKGGIGQGGGGGAGQIGLPGCTGASGGSGGAGGCGGNGGLGGQPGGSSIGIVSVNAVNLRLVKVMITTSNGGPGGTGGNGQFGGTGAIGASGGGITMLNVEKGCKGGNGGDGGRGGPGGGGAGGHSLAIAYIGNAPVGDFMEALGPSGTGGTGGDGMPKGNAGDPGQSEKLLQFDTLSPN
jgi:hypothetical protein